MAEVTLFQQHMRQLQYKKLATDLVEASSRLKEAWDRYHASRAELRRLAEELAGCPLDWSNYDIARYLVLYLKAREKQ